MCCSHVTLCVSVWCIYGGVMCPVEYLPPPISCTARHEVGASAIAVHKCWSGMLHGLLGEGSSTAELTEQVPGAACFAVRCLRVGPKAHMLEVETPFRQCMCALKLLSVPAQSSMLLCAGVRWPANHWLCPTPRAEVIFRPRT